MIDEDAAVFYHPDSNQLNRIQSIISPSDFQSHTHEFFFQMRNARKSIKRDWPKLKVVETKKHRYLLFRSKSTLSFLIDLDDYPEFAGIVLFKKGKQPHQVDMMNIDTELLYYFK